MFTDQLALISQQSYKKVTTDILAHVLSKLTTLDMLKVNKTTYVLFLHLFHSKYIKIYIKKPLRTESGLYIPLMFVGAVYAQKSVYSSVPH